MTCSRSCWNPEQSPPYRLTPPARHPAAASAPRQKPEIQPSHLGSVFRHQQMAGIRQLDDNECWRRLKNDPGTKPVFVPNSYGRRTAAWFIAGSRMTPLQRKFWPHKVWDSGDIPGGQNTYFGLSSLRPDDESEV